LTESDVSTGQPDSRDHGDGIAPSASFTRTG
jgi:hypothetical protein